MNPSRLAPPHVHLFTPTLIIINYGKMQFRLTEHKVTDSEIISAEYSEKDNKYLIVRFKAQDYTHPYFCSLISESDKRDKITVADLQLFVIVANRTHRTKMSNYVLLCDKTFNIVAQSKAQTVLERDKDQFALEVADGDPHELSTTLIEDSNFMIRYNGVNYWYNADIQNMSANETYYVEYVSNTYATARAIIRSNSSSNVILRLCRRD